MDKEALKALGLTDEQVTAVFEDYGKNYVTKAQFNERLDELKHVKEEREKTAKELEETWGSAAGIEESDFAASWRNPASKCSLNRGHYLRRLFPCLAP